MQRKVVNWPLRLCSHFCMCTSLVQRLIHATVRNTGKENYIIQMVLLASARAEQPIYLNGLLYLQEKVPANTPPGTTAPCVHAGILHMWAAGLLKEQCFVCGSLTHMIIHMFLTYTYVNLALCDNHDMAPWPANSIMLI